MATSSAPRSKSWRDDSKGKREEARRRGSIKSPDSSITAIVAFIIGLIAVAIMAFQLSFSTKNSAAAVVVLSYLGLTTASSVSVDAGWHAPAQTEINNLTEAFTHDGVYGFIYNTSHTPDEVYGIYNWCNMPHVRAREYVKAGDEFELQYVELIHRHHKRTPYASNSFPVESYEWNCDDSGLYSYGEPFAGQDAARGYRDGFTSPVNPFTKPGFQGSCQFPQITAEGLDDSWQHGADLYGVYHGVLGFLPGKGDGDFASKVKYRVTNNPITSQVAGMLINGMWGVTEPYPLLAEAEGIDSLEPQYSCPVGSNLFNSIKSDSNPAWKEHLERAADLYGVLDDISGVPSDDGGFHMSFDHYYDNLSARQCHGKPLPCKLVDGANSTTCVDQELANEVYRLGHWEYSQIYRDSSSSLPASATSFGIWIGELTAHLRDVMAGSSETIYFHNVAHDGSVSRLLSILQLDHMVWPGMGSEIVFELYKKRAGDGSSGPQPTTTAGAPTSCNHDNCLRHLVRHTSEASSLCAAYATASSAEYPTAPSECDEAGQIQSACSCLAYPTATTTMTTVSPQTTSAPSISASGYYVRVLFGGQVLKSSNPMLGEMNMVPAEDLIAYFEALIGEGAQDVKGKCQGNIPLNQ